MSVAKAQIHDGIVEFLKREVVSQITDRSFKSILNIITKVLETKPELLDQFLDNNMVATVLDKDENGNYDIDTMIDIIEDSIVDNGPFVITIPGIKFISPDEKTLTFNADDFEKLKNYIDTMKIEAKENS